jgi:hypothetical protein
MTTRREPHRGCPARSGPMNSEHADRRANRLPRPLARGIDLFQGLSACQVAKAATGTDIYSGQRRRAEWHTTSFMQVGGMWRCRQERAVKPSAQPTLVRTQHLPPPAKTARSLRKRGPAGRFLLVPPCVIVCRGRSLRSLRTYGGQRPSRRSGPRNRLLADPRPFCPVTQAPGLLV